MAAVADAVNIYEQESGQSDVANSPFAYKEIMAVTADTADATDTFTVTLSDYGITTLLNVKGFKHTTNNSVIVLEQPTTAVAAGVLTVTIPGGSDNDIRVVLIGGI